VQSQSVKPSAFGLRVTPPDPHDCGVLGLSACATAALAR